MDLSIIIVNYNTKELLQKCLESVFSEERGVRSWEIIVVDNNSTDGTREMVKKLQSQHSELRTIFNKKNEGFAKAINQGIKQSRGEYLLLLNSDIIAKPNSIKRLVDFAEKHPGVGVVGGRLLNSDGSSQGSCFFLPTLWRVVKEFWLGNKRFSVVKKYVPEGKRPSEVEAVTGAVFLIPKRILSKVGFFNERYFMYFEDLDYCRRVRKTGLKIYYLPEAEFIHAHGASGQQIPQQTRQWLVGSSKIYHGKLRYYLITFIIWSNQKWQFFC